MSLHLLLFFNPEQSQSLSELHLRLIVLTQQQIDAGFELMHVPQLENLTVLFLLDL